MLTHIGTKTIETKRLILRRFEYTDDDAMLKYWVADEKIQSLYSEPIYPTKKEVKELLDKYIGSYEKNDYYRWAIIEKISNECIGQIAYFLVDSKNHFAEIEYCIGSDFQCKGFATEAAKAIISYGFNSMNLQKCRFARRLLTNLQNVLLKSVDLLMKVLYGITFIWMANMSADCIFLCYEVSLNATNKSR